MVSRIALKASSSSLALVPTASGVAEQCLLLSENAQKSYPAPLHIHPPPSTPIQTKIDTSPLSIQVRYAATAIEPGKSARARGAYLRVSFKNTRETAQAINGWKLQRALSYLGNVIDHKEAVPMRRYAGSTGRTAQGE